ncbi:hypothetical protein P245_20280 [Comamonas thiooxydans]|uniref:Uncharacterized protein n=1 Tax=Comamonas thiooxydans TaxID=363952 RepID=A0A0E3BA87_9BURK|nr:hypothetical protein [Comamonas thiooxydans]KGG87403.1 hypothetical protein P245_20280 [Comamonas thiooxydans]
MHSPEVPNFDANLEWHAIAGAEKLLQWMTTLDGLRQECDGMCRCVSTLLTRDVVPHRIHAGYVVAHSIGKSISPHLWIELEGGVFFDLRARMWLGNHESIPHGLFRPRADVEYFSSEEISPDRFGYPLSLFEVLAEAPLSAFP